MSSASAEWNMLVLLFMGLLLVITSFIFSRKSLDGHCNNCGSYWTISWLHRCFFMNKFSRKVLRATVHCPKCDEELKL